MDAVGEVETTRLFAEEAGKEEGGEEEVRKGLKRARGEEGGREGEGKRDKKERKENKKNVPVRQQTSDVH